MLRPHNWVKSLRRYVAEAFPEHENILGEVGDEDTIDDYRGYESLTIVERVKLLHHICVARVAGLGDYVPPDMMNKVLLPPPSEAFTPFPSALSSVQVPLCWSSLEVVTLPAPLPHTLAVVLDVFVAFPPLSLPSVTIHCLHSPDL